MAHPLTVEVTQAHIDAGKRGDCRRCPLALAIMDKGYGEVCVFRTFVTIVDTRQNYSLDHQATVFVDTVDHGFYVSPGVFTLTPMMRP